MFVADLATTPALECHPTTLPCSIRGGNVVTVLVWSGLFCTMQAAYYKSTSLRSARPTRPCPMSPRGAFKPPAPPNAHLTAGIIHRSPYDAQGGTGGQGGGGDPDGGSKTPPAADPATEPPAVGGPADQRESTEVTEDDALEAPAAPPEGATFKASGGDEKSDEDDDDDDDDDAAPVPPANPPRRVSSRVKGVAAPEPADVMAGTKKDKRPPRRRRIS